MKRTSRRPVSVLALEAPPTLDWLDPWRVGAAAPTPSQIDGARARGLARPLTFQQAMEASQAAANARAKSSAVSRTLVSAGRTCGSGGGGRRGLFSVHGWDGGAGEQAALRKKARLGQSHTRYGLRQEG
jgi:hypothetical protein